MERFRLIKVAEHSSDRVRARFTPVPEIEHEARVADRLTPKAGRWHAPGFQMLFYAVKQHWGSPELMFLLCSPFKSYLSRNFPATMDES
jgi:hypothetical protein